MRFITVDNEHCLQMAVQQSDGGMLLYHISLSEIAHYTMGWHIQQITELLKSELDRG